MLFGLLGRPDRPEEPLISEDLRRRNLDDFRNYLELKLFPEQRRVTNKRIPIQFIKFDDTGNKQLVTFIVQSRDLQLKVSRGSHDIERKVPRPAL
jgi:hypothetical protein